MSCGTHLNFEVNSEKNMLTVAFLEEFLHEIEPDYGRRNRPFSRSEVYLTAIESAERLSHGEDVKTVYKLSLSGASTEPFLPGDAVGVLPKNAESDVSALLGRLNAAETADRICRVEGAPKHVPPVSTLRCIFTDYVDINTPPKKLFLKELARYISSAEEAAELQQLDYTKFVTGQGASLLGLLEAFPSCAPPVGLLLGHLPPLQPRFYSLSSSPIEDNVEITFFVWEKAGGRKGVCTGWLESLIVNESKSDKIPVYFRHSNNFKIPVNCAEPLIFVGAGTGIAPFRGYLRNEFLDKNSRRKGEIWLIYGCRYEGRDCLYRDEIDGYLQSGVLKRVDFAFSRDGPGKVYVQDRIEEFGADFVEWVVARRGRVFVCGDFKSVVKGVKGAVLKNLVGHGEMGEGEADSYVKNMEKEGRFVVDMW